MFKNKILIFIILMIALLSIGIASATESSINATDTVSLDYDDSSTEVVTSAHDENTTLDVASEDNIETSSDDVKTFNSFSNENTQDDAKSSNSDNTTFSNNNLISSNSANQNNILASEEPKTFTQLNDAISSDTTGTLTLDSNYTMTLGESDSFRNGITISKNITIDGKGFTIDANKLKRIFEINDDCEVSLFNVTLINGLAYDGGAILNDGNLTLINVAFINNTADSYYGAAIYHYGDKLSVINCTFIHNTNTKNSGGAIYNRGSNFTVYNSTFVNNSAVGWGGAIAIDNYGFVSGCTFINNSAVCGGAIGGNRFTLSNCIFVNNSATDSGGAIKTSAGGVISNSVFINNTAPNGNAVHSNGYYDPCTAYDNWWGTNTPDWSSLLNDEVAHDNYTVLSLKASNNVVYLNFYRNGTTTNINIPEREVKLTSGGDEEITGKIVNGKFNITCPAGAYKLTAEVDNQELDIVLPIYVDPKGTDGDGYGLSWEKPFKTIAYAMSNAISGGEIYLSDGSHIVDSQITINEAVTIIGNGTKTFITNNKKDYGVFSITANNVAIYNSTFVNNSVSGYVGGSAIYVPSDISGLVVSGCIFVNNSAYHGGAIYVVSSGSDFTVSNCTFVNNSAEYDGGAIYNGASGSVSDCTFLNNSATWEGGAISNHGYGSNVSNSIFVNNSAEYDGGAIYNGASGFTVSGCSFVNNFATSYSGGAIFNYFGDDFTVSNSIFVNNSVEHDGGAIYTYGSTLIVSCIFINNTASNQGGAISNPGYSSNVSNSIFVNNTAGWVNGGNAIYAGSNSPIIDDNWWGTNNPIWKDLVRGNAIYNTYAVLSLTATNNKVTINFYRNGTNEVLNEIPTRDVSLTIGNQETILTEITDGTFEKGYTAPEGEYNITAIVDNQKLAISFLNNIYVDPEKGSNSNTGADWNNAVETIEHAMEIVLANGNIYLADGTHKVTSQITIDKTISIVGNGTKTLITNNKNGNVVFKVTASDVAIYNSTFVNNTIYGWTGTIYVEYGMSGFTVSGCSFINNSAGEGSAIYNGGPDLTVSNSTFVNNSADYYGGAIYNFGGSDFTVDDCDFVNNSAKYGAGAIYNYASDLNVSNCNFINNTVSSGSATGGAIYNSGTSDSTISNSKFENNDATRGAAIYNGGYDGYYKATISLNNNTYSGIKEGKTYIYNAGTLASPVNITVLENKTIKAHPGETIKLNATVTCDGATVAGGTLKFLIDSEEYGVANSNDDGNYTLDYTVAYFEGSKVISASYSADKESVKDATLNCVIETFTDLQNAINDASVISLTSDVKMTADEASEFASGISISKDLTINGNGFTIDANKSGRIFNIASGFTINLNNATLANGKTAATDDGGAIYNNGALTLTNVTFVNNSAGVSGGAIWNHGSGLNVSNCSFVNNSAGNRGGAIDNSGSAFISNSKFSNNTADKGVIFNAGTLTLNNNTYSGISGSKTYIYNTYYGTLLSPVNITVLGNETIRVHPGETITLIANVTCDGATVAGGTLKFFIDSEEYMGDVTSNLDGNYTSEYPVPYFEEPKVISASYTEANNVSVKDATLNCVIETFTDLQNAINDASVISLTSDVKMTADEASEFVSGISISKDLIINGNGFTIGANKSGRIFNVNAGCTLSLNDVTLANGKTTKGGGAIYNSGTLLLTNVTFANNSANNGGGAIFNYGSGSTVSGCSFVNNSATDYGGAIYNIASGLTVDACTFVNNSATRSGGAIDNEASDFTVTNSVFVNNTATQGNSIYSSMSCKANDNWWGTNTPKWDDLIYGDYDCEVTHDTYAVLSLTATSDNVAINFYKNGTTEVLNKIPTRDVSLTIGDEETILTEITDGTFNKAYDTPEGEYDITAVVDNQKLAISFLNNIYVDPVKGSNSNTGADWNNAVKTIEYAMKYVLANGKIFLADGTHIVNNRITIDKTISIVGNGTKTLITNNKNGNGVFKITASGVGIYNSTFVNNSASIYGGAIYNDASSLTVSGCSFVNNSAGVYYSGGAIFNRDGSGLTVTNSVFVNNTADDGDAIYSEKDCTANDNWWGNNTPDWDKLVNANVAHDTYAVLNLTATSDNIALKFYRNGSTDVLKIPTRDLSLTIGNQPATSNEIVNGTFETNYVIPAIGEYVIKANVDNQELTVTLTNNNVYVDPEGNDGNTGASWSSPFKTIQHAMDKVLTNGNIYLSDGTHKVDSQITINKAVTIIGNGTKTIVTTNKTDRVFTVSASNVAIYNSTFANNSAINSGGAINVLYSVSSFVVSGCTFVNNSVNGKYGCGGAINGVVSAWTVSNCTFVNNSADNGGAIFGYSSDLIVDDCTFVNNSASYGGAIYNVGSGSVSNSKFINNSADMGVIFNSGRLTLNNKEYSGISDGKTYIYNAGTLASPVNITVLGNKTVKVHPGETIKLNATVTCDGATVAGGTLRFIINGVKCEDEVTSNLDGNYTLEYPITYFEGSKVISASYSANEVTVKNATLKYSIETFTDLKNAMEYTDSISLTSDVKLAADESFPDGIAISKDLTINGNGFTIDAKQLGRIFKIGDRYSSSILTVTLNNVTLANGKAMDTTYGGAIESYGELILTNVTFVNNFATDNGGAIYSDGSSLTVSDCTFVNNSASLLGGAIYNYDSDFTITNSEFINNSAEDSAGAFFNYDGSGSVDDCSFVNNSAGGSGAICNSGSGFTITNSEFINNSAESTGGVIENMGEISIIDSKFINNSASYGGVIENIGEISIIDSKFDNNSADYGDAIYNLGTLSLNNNKYSGVTEDKVYIYNDGTLASCVITVLEGKTINKYYGEEITLFANVTCDGASVAGGTLSFTIDNDKYEATSQDNGNYTYEYTIDFSGEKLVNAIYKNADANYVTVKNAILNVSKYDPKVNVTIKETKFGEDLNINVKLPEDTKGNVTIIVDGITYNKTIENGNVDLAIGNLGAGLHGVIVKYPGSEKYLDDEVIKFVNISKVEATLAVNIEDISYGDAFTIEATLTGIKNTPLNGNVIVTINNKNYTVSINNNGEGKLEVSDKLPANTYQFTASWYGDDNYSKTDFTDSFKIAQINPTFTVEGSDIYVGENETIKFNLPADATGTVTIKVGNYSNTVSVDEGKDIIVNLKAGNYTATITYSGDNNYNNVTKEYNFTVSKIKPDSHVIFYNTIDYDSYYDILFDLPYDATGNVSAIINGTTYPVEMNNGFGYVPIPILDAGEYNFTITFNGDDKYEKSIVESSFKVLSVDPNLNVIIDNGEYGKDSTIIATLTGVNNTQLNGTVEVTIGEETYYITVTDGKGILNNLEFLAGDYNFTATWEGTNNYNPAQDTGSFKIARSNPTFNVDVPNIFVDEDEIIKFNLPTDATGNVTIKVGNYSNTVPVTEGMDIIANLKAGNYTAIITYSGDDNYNSLTKEFNFTVSRSYPAGDILWNNITYGSGNGFTAIFSIDAKGTVTFNINGTSHILELDDGWAYLDVSNMDAGSYTFNATYSGDNKYHSVYFSNMTFNILPANPNLNVIIDNGEYNKNLTIIATLNGVNNTSLNGTVVITINNKTYNVTVVDGKGISKDITLPAGEYNFTATWKGTNNYNPAYDTGSFEIAKINPTIDVTSQDIYVGEDEIIEVILPEDATGEVVITVDDVNYTVKVENGTAKQNITGLKTMNETSLTYLVHVKYLGDNNYNNITALDDEFTVYKVSSYDMNVTIPTDVKYGDNTTITVDVPSDATGNVTVSVDGENYTAKVENGTANITISPLSPGIHNITTTYSGDEKYDPVTEKGNITVISNDVNLTAEGVVMIYKDGSRLIAKLLDALGNPIANATLTFAINGREYNRTTDINGTASIALNLESGKYNTTITYSGSESYNPASVNATVTITPSIIGEDIVKMYQNDTQFYAKFLDSHGKPLANITVKFNINGVFYNRTTDENGTARLNINLNPGNYTLTAYNPDTGEQQGFNVLVKSLIEASDLTKYYNNESKFQAKIYNKDGSLAVNKSVTFNINGVFYTRETDENGTVKLAINLRPGNYTITTTYDGLSIGNNVKVLPTLITNDLTMTYKDSSKFNATVLDGHGNPLSNQNVTFNVNGVFYNKVTGGDGVASLNINLFRGKYIITSIWDEYQTGNKITIS